MSAYYIVPSVLLLGVFLIDMREDGINKTIRDFVLLVFTVIPLVFSPSKKYIAISDIKYYSFLSISLAFFVAILVFYIKRLYYLKVNTICLYIKSLSLSHKLLLLLFVDLTLSWLLSGHIADCFGGAAGFHTGYLFQTILIIIYFIITYHYEMSETVICSVFIVSSIVFVLGIMNRLMIDPLKFYASIKDTETMIFISTIGQASWYSSYLCLLLPIGMSMFVASGRNSSLWKYFSLLVYQMVAFASLVTQNSDSAFVSLLIMIIIEFAAAVIDPSLFLRIGYQLMLIGTTFMIMGFITNSIKNTNIEFDYLSRTMMNWRMDIILLLWGLLVVIIAVLVMKKDINNSFIIKVSKMIVAILILVSICVLGIFITNSFGWTSIGRDSFDYLFFDDAWGNSRGKIWRASYNLYMDLPIHKKLIGVGPDGYQFYIYGYINGFSPKRWQLNNAHNEWFNMMINGGFIGGTLYILFYLSNIYCISKKYIEHKKWFYLGGIMSVCGYISHNFFCYQQCISTPMIFIIMAITISHHRIVNVTEIDS